MKKHLHELNALELQQVVADLSQRLHQRSEPMTIAVLDTFDQWISMAEDPGHSHNMVARALIRRWVDAQDRMRGIAAGLAIAKELPKQ